MPRVADTVGVAGTVGMVAVAVMVAAGMAVAMVADGMAAGVVAGMAGSDGARGGGDTPITRTIRITTPIMRRLWSSRRSLKNMSSLSRSKRNPATGISARIRKDTTRT